MSQQTLDSDDLVFASDGIAKINSNFSELYSGGSAVILGADYGLTTSASVDQTAALEAAIAASASLRRPLLLPAGPILYTGPLSIPTNAHIYGSAGQSFGTQLIANGTSGVYFDGSGTERFHASLNDVLLDHIGAAGVYACKIENTYSIRLRRVRFDTPAAAYTDAALAIDNTNNDILIEDPIMQFATEQNIGIRLGNDCGTIRLVKPDVEKCQRAIKWEGGKIEVYSPYIETASVNGIDLTPNSADTGAFFKVFGGVVGISASAVGVAIRADAHDVDFFGTKISGSTSNDIYSYSNSINRVNFWNPVVDYAKVNGVVGYLRYVGLHGRRLFGSKTQDWASIASGAGASTTVTVSGARLGYHTARCWMDISTSNLALVPSVTADDTVTVVALNLSGGAIDLASAGLYVVCDPAVRQ